MPSACVAARFDSPEALEAALCDLRRLGAVRCAGALGLRPGGAPAVLRVSVRPGNASLARAILRRAGGSILPSP